MPAVKVFVRFDLSQFSRSRAGAGSGNQVVISPILSLHRFAFGHLPVDHFEYIHEAQDSDNPSFSVTSRSTCKKNATL
jgi:hypothetical protein